MGSRLRRPLTLNSRRVYSSGAYSSRSLSRYGGQGGRNLWVGSLLGGLYVVLMVLRLRLGVLWPEGYAHWWRATQVLRLGGGIDPARGLYPAELPLYTWLNRTLLQWLSPGIPAVTLLQGMTVGFSLLIVLWLWGRGHVWSAGLYALSPWLMDWGLDPNPEVIGAFFLLLGGVATTWRFGWLAVACGFSPYTWPFAALLAVLWSSQHWHRYRLRGILVVGSSIGLGWLSLGDQMGLVAFPPAQGRLEVVAPLVLTLGLALVRLGWPWSQRQQAVVALAVAPLMLVRLLAGLWDPALGAETARLGLVALPLLCDVAGGVLAEIPTRGWRHFLGGLLLLGTISLTLQLWPTWIHQAALNQDLELVAAQVAAQVQPRDGEVGSLALVDSAQLVYFAGLPIEGVLGSGALESLYGDPLPEQVGWLVLNRSDRWTGSRSPLLNRYAEFAFHNRLLQWRLVDPSPSDLANWSNLAARAHVRVWQRQPLASSP